MSRHWSPEFRAWVEEARAAPILEAALARGAQLKGGAVEKCGPCPACGDGVDRFSVNMRKRLFFCRYTKATGDVIAMVQYLEGVNFVRACESLTGRPPPQGRAMSAAERERISREQEERRRAEAERRAQRDREAERYRQRAISAARGLWDRSQPARGTPAEAYLMARGVSLPATARLRYAPDLPYFIEDGGERRTLFRGPAMIAAITAGGVVTGAHRTWIDLDQPNGKRVIVDPATGEILPAKKVVGSKRRGLIVLDAACGRAPERLIVGEGIETVLSVREALIDAACPKLGATLFVSSVDLGNLAGRARGSERHPTLRKIDKAGRSRAVMVPGPEPDMGEAGLAIPESAVEMILLQDGDSEPVATRNAMLRAAARYARPGLTIRCAAAPEGMDFNDLILAGEMAGEDA